MIMSNSASSFLFVGGWGHGGSGFKRPSGFRSKSSVKDQPASKSNAPSPKVTNMAAVQHPKSAPSYFHARNASSGLNTLPDPRSPSPSTVQRNGTPDSHPDLSTEVAMLSTKLINAINHQTNLDDSLQSARAELEGAREKIAQLEAANREHTKQSEQGLVVSRAEYDRMLEQLSRELNVERQARTNVEKEKKRIEGELENLTTALFEEANQMVAAARKDREASETRNKQLRSQLNDTELLLASQQEQLQDLKAVMEKMESERDESESNPQVSTAPSTPALEKMNRMFDSNVPSPYTPAQFINPEHPLHFDHLIQPLLRHDIQAYDDFQAFFQASGGPPSRTPSGNYGSLLGLASLNNSSSTSVNQQSNGPASKNIARSHMSSKPSSASLVTSPSSSGSFGTDSHLPPLKDTKFYKRVLSEDIEPSLRLDLAPSLSFFNRRALLSSIASGSLAIEPFSAPTINYGPAPLFPCTLCGENRKGDRYVRRWRMKASDEEGAQRWALCEWCCTRVRSTAELAGFLRTIQRGMWRSTNGNRRISTDGNGKDNANEAEKGKEAGKEAWEECVSLRERMFWARIGGGVVPTAMNGDKGLGISKGVDIPIIDQALADQGKESERKAKPSIDEIRSTQGNDEAESTERTGEMDTGRDDPFAAAAQATNLPSTPSHPRKQSSVSDRPLPIPHRQSLSSANGTSSSSSIPVAHTLSRDLNAPEIIAQDESPTTAKEDEASAPQTKSEEADARAKAVAARIRLFNEKEKGLGRGSRNEWQRGISDARARSTASDVRGRFDRSAPNSRTERSKSPMPPIPTAGALHVRKVSGESASTGLERSRERSRDRRSGPTEEIHFDVERRVEEEVRKTELKRERGAEEQRKAEEQRAELEKEILAEDEESKAREENQIMGESKEYEEEVPSQEPTPIRERDSFDIPGAFA